MNLIELFNEFVKGNISAEDFQIKAKELSNNANLEDITEQSKTIVSQLEKTTPALSSLFLGLATINLQDEQALKNFHEQFKKMYGS